MGIILGITWNFDKAIHYFRESLKLKDSISNNKFFDILMKIGICHR